MGWFEENEAALEAAGIPRDAAEDFIRRNQNPGGTADYHRIIEALGPDYARRAEAQSGGGGGGGGSNMASLQIPYTPFTEAFTPSIAMPGDAMDPWTRSFTAPSYEQVQQSPAFRFRLDEALKALERSAAAKGSYLTPNTMQGLMETSQGMASDEYEREYGRRRHEYVGDFDIFSSDRSRRAGIAGSQFDRDLAAYQTKAGIHRTNQLDPWGMTVDLRRENRADRTLDFDIAQGLWGRGYQDRSLDFSMGDTTRKFDWTRDTDLWQRQRSSYNDRMHWENERARHGRPG